MSKYLRVGYLLVDASLTILLANDLIPAFFQEESDSLNGRLLTDLLPELVGVEPVLQEISQGIRPSFILRQVQRNTNGDVPFYFDMIVEPVAHDEASLLVVVTDVTTITQQAQRLQQQRNELGMLTARLTAAREQLAYVIRRFVPTAVAQEIIEQQQLPLPGKTQGCEATIVFADMRNFTEMAEALTPEQTLDILNHYLTVVIEALQQYDGSIVQIVGDMVMASFNVPLAQPDHASRAVAAAQGVVASLRQFATQPQGAALPAVGFGLGICSGMVTAGYLGAAQRYRYAVVGDATNVAFHLCSRAASGQILVADSTARLLGDTTGLRALGQVTLKRRREQIAFYEVCTV
ncbi:MAG: adenylate/guanylate cyclase domain-containing protein [Chloroflexota bacterium]